jgi:nucleotide-binding universal stress UspA family protein
MGPWSSSSRRAGQGTIQGSPNSGRAMGEIVIGVDGSEPSHRALQWAMEEARLRDDVVVVVHAYERQRVRNPYASAYPYIPGDTFRVATDYERRMQEELDTHARQQADSVIQRALDEAGGGAEGPVVKRLTVARDAARTLVEMSEHADLLVVGSRGHGGFTGLLLGSVSQHCAHHARCPVVVIR